MRADPPPSHLRFGDVLRDGNRQPARPGNSAPANRWSSIVAWPDSRMPGTSLDRLAPVIAHYHPADWAMPVRVISAVATGSRFLFSSQGAFTSSTTGL